MKRRAFMYGSRRWYRRLRKTILSLMPLWLRRELTGREVMERLYENIKKRLRGEEVKLKHTVHAIIADDSDYHRTRIGYMGYESAIVVAVNGKRWAVAFGEACGDYPADPYDCEIAAVSLPSRIERSREETLGDIAWQLERSAWFRNSLIFAMSDGRLAHTARAGGLGLKNAVGKKMIRLIQGKAKSFVISDRVTHPNLISVATMDKVVVRGPRYKPGLVRELTRAAEETLRTVEKDGLDQLPVRVYE